MSQNQEAIVVEEWEGRRLDAITKLAFSLSWNKARDWIGRGKVFIGGEVVTDLHFVPQVGATISLRLDAPKPRQSGQLTKDALVYVDRHIVVVHKPSGLLTVPFEDFDRGTLVQQVRLLLPRQRNARGQKGNAPGLFVVHRLDKATSGVMLFARSARARDGLSQQFRDHTAHRRYLALAHGEVEEVTHRSHLVKDRGDGTRGSRENSRFPKVRRSKGGKLAITHVSVEQPLKGATLVSCQLETGRTNQIRIHLAEAGHPILGETTYMRDYEERRIYAPRLMLHASELGFVHPVLKREFQFEAPLPNEMQALVDSLSID